MATRVTIAELQKRVTLTPDEAIAITQQLIENCANAARELQPPYGPPSPSTVYLLGDGSVACPSCEATLAVSEAAIFLQTLLPAASRRVSGSLRYMIARALLDVDAPPFDSIQEFSTALARFERGDRAGVIRELLLRASADALAGFERRRNMPSPAVLRRELRDADVRVYDQQLALEALSALTPNRPPRPRRWFAITGAAVMAIAIIGVGEAIPKIDAGGTPVPPPATAPHPLPRAADAASVAPSAPAPPFTPQAPARRTVRPAHNRTRAAQRTTPVRQSKQGGILKRLHMDWLKTRIVVRDTL